MGRKWDEKLWDDLRSEWDEHTKKNCRQQDASISGQSLGTKGDEIAGTKFIHEKMLKGAAYGRALNTREPAPLAAAAWTHGHIAHLREHARPLHAIQLGDERDQFGDKIIAHQFHNLVFAAALATVQ